MRLVAAALVLPLALGACGCVKVVPSDADVKAAPRASGCEIEFLRKAPDRPYDELAELSTHVTNPPREGPEYALRAKACELGADAVIVTQSFVTNPYGHVLVAGTAIKYREEPARPAPAEGPAAGSVGL